jgi:thioredoxin reductase
VDGEHDVDVVVVGGGPAGLAAAGWLARYRRLVTVVDSGEHRADRVEASHGYLGRDPQVPRELLARGREELLAYDTARVLDGCVERVERLADRRFAVALDDGRRLLARRLVLACGVVDVLPPAPGIDEHYGASVFHCPSCDGYEARDRDVVALGWDAHLAGFAGQLTGWARSVTVVTAGRRFRGDETTRALLARHGIEVVEEAVASLLGPRGDLRGVRLVSGRTIPCSLAFFSIEHRPRVELARSLGCALDPDGYVAVNDCGMSSVEGVYAAGDLVPGLQLTAVAAATGVVAGVACAQSFFGEPSAPAAPDPAPDLTAERERVGR